MIAQTFMGSKHKIIFLMLAVFIFGCSTRQVYQPSEIAFASSPNTININTATVDEIEKLPHIGPKTAEAITRFRDENGPFRRVEHLMQIRGISEKRFLEIRQFLKTE